MPSNWKRFTLSLPLPLLYACPWPQREPGLNTLGHCCIILSMWNACMYPSFLSLSVSLFLSKDLFSYIYVSRSSCMSSCVPHVCKVTQETRGCPALKLELQRILSHRMWVQGTKPWSSRRTLSALNCWAISQARKTNSTVRWLPCSQPNRIGLWFPATMCFHLNLRRKWKKD